MNVSRLFLCISYCILCVLLFHSFLLRLFFLFKKADDGGLFPEKKYLELLRLNEKVIFEILNWKRILRRSRGKSGKLLFFYFFFQERFIFHPFIEFVTPFST